MLTAYRAVICCFASHFPSFLSCSNTAHIFVQKHISFDMLHLLLQFCLLNMFSLLFENSQPQKFVLEFFWLFIGRPSSGWLWTQNKTVFVEMTKLNQKCCFLFLLSKTFSPFSARSISTTHWPHGCEYWCPRDGYHGGFDGRNGHGRKRNDFQLSKYVSFSGQPIWTM